jgi:outer membrane protein assembly factor BamB
MIWESELRRYIYSLVPVFILILSGCSSKQGLEAVPTPLTAIDSEFTTVKNWSHHLSLTADKAHGYYQQVVIAEGSAYISDDKGVVHALSVKSGRSQWQNKTDLLLSSGLAYGEGLVLVGSYDGDVMAIAAADGQTRWRSRVSSEVLAPPTISDGVVIVRSIDGKLAALDIADGHRLWSYQVQVPTLSLHGNSTALVYQDRVIIGLDDGRLAALDLRDGRVLWEATVAVPQGRSELQRLVDVDANPVQFDGIIYAAAFQGRVVAVDMQSGRLIWARDLSVYRGLAVDNDSLYVVDDQDGVWALSRRNGATLWKQEGLLARSLTAPILKGDYVIVADLEGNVHWLRRQDGGFVARADIGEMPITVLKQDDSGALYSVALDGYITKINIGKRREKTPVMSDEL